MYQNFIIPYLYEAQHVSGDTPPIIRSLKLHWQPLVFHMWKVVGHVVGGHCQAHFTWQRPRLVFRMFHVWKTRGCKCSFRLLMMSSVSPETCWALYKYGIIKFWYIVASCWIFLYELYYDARIHEHPTIELFSHCFHSEIYCWEFGLSGMWQCVTGWVVLSVSKECTATIFKNQEAILLGPIYLCRWRHYIPWKC